MSDDSSDSNLDKSITFKEKYNEIGLTWQEKCVLISLYHTAMCIKFKTWTLTDTALHFEVSIGLVSENIKLAKWIDSVEIGSKLMQCETREKALKLVDQRKFPRFKLH